MHSSTFVTCCAAERSAFRPSGCDRCRFRRAVRNHESPCHSSLGRRASQPGASRTLPAPRSKTRASRSLFAVGDKGTVGAHKQRTNPMCSNDTEQCATAGRAPGAISRLPARNVERDLVRLEKLARRQAFSDGARRHLPRAQRTVEREVRHCWGILT